MCNPNPIFYNYIMAGYPLLWVETHEEYRAMKKFVKEIKTAKEEYTFYSWNRIDGIQTRQLNGDLLTHSKIDTKIETKDPMVALDWMGSNDLEDNSIFFLQDFHHYIKKDVVQRKIKNLIPAFKSSGKIIVIISHALTIPPEIVKEVTVIQFKLPDVNELRIVLQGVCESAVSTYPENDVPLLEAALGMTATEAENAFSLSMIEEKCIDVDAINKEKATIVKKTDLLEVIDVTETLDDIGGLYDLKEWLIIRKRCSSQKAREFGIKPPKGALFVGPPGNGKSLTSKVIAKIWQRPLLRLDMGKISGSLVGESEERARRCISMVDAMAPCLTGDTRILLSDGKEVTIKYLYENYPNGGFKVIGFNNGELLPTNVLKVTKKISNKNYKFIYSDGECIGYSWNHLQPIMRDGNISWIKTENVKVGDYIATPLGEIKLSSTVFYDYLPKCRFYKKYTNKKDSIKSSYSNASIIAYGHGGYTDSLLYKWPKEINEKFFYLLGLIESDGSLNKTISFTNTEKKLIDKFKEIVYDLFGIECKEQFIDKKEAKERGKKLKGLKKNNFSDYWILHFNSKIIYLIFKKIKDHIHGFDSLKIKNFLAGYIDGDGNVDCSKYPRITFCAHKKKERILIKSLLKRIGILPSKGTNKGIVVSGQQIKILKSLSLNHPEKKNKLNSLKLTTKQADKVRVFPIGHLIKEMRKDTQIPSHKFKTAVNSEIHAWENNLRPIPENRLKLIANELESIGHTKWAHKLNLILNSSLRWLKVKIKKEINTREVFDLCCENIHNFIANGILTHNCVLWIDEVEKSFSNMNNGNSHESSKKVLATFLTWMAERKTDVFIALTANDATVLPPALIRGGRIDVVFWVDFPQNSEREKVISIHLKKVDRDPKNFDMKKLVKATNGFSSSEIEVWINDTLVISFDKDTNLSTNDLIESSKEVSPISVLMAEEIKSSLDWAEKRKVKRASKKELDEPQKATKRKISMDNSGNKPGVIAS